MNIKLRVKEYRKKYGAIGTWIDDNLYNFCFKNIEQSYQVSRNSSIGVTFPLIVYIFFWIGCIKYFRSLGYTTKNVEFVYLHVMCNDLLLSTKRLYLFIYFNITMIIISTIYSPIQVTNEMDRWNTCSNILPSKYSFFKNCT